ncbi:SDR family NAD(P)-dependent oxidoreductase [Thermodesulfobacteriota bacterium]
MEQRLKGKTAIVTGAAAGMGSAHALALAQEGAYVAVADICEDQANTPIPGGKSEDLDSLANEITSIAGKSMAVHGDVSNADDVERMVETVISEFGRIDILVNNAGVVSFAPLVDLSEEQWDLVMDVNLKGTFLCCKSVLPHMIAQKSGKIVNVGSVDGREGEPRMVHYCCSKAGVHMLTDALSKEVAKYNINVNCVAPGTIWGTNMVGWGMGSAAADEMEAHEKYLEYVKKRYTFGREQTPEDLANAMLFLVSEESRNITGYTIYVDGGHKGFV